MHKVIEAAKSLLSDGSNVEYDRAILELAATLLGVREEDRDVLQAMIEGRTEFRYEKYEVTALNVTGDTPPFVWIRIWSRDDMTVTAVPFSHLTVA